VFTYVIKLIVTVVIIGAAAMLFFAKSPGFPVSSVVTQKESLFSVSGDGKVTVVPDTAIVQLGITSTGATVKVVQTQANQVINAISEKTKSLGVAAKDIETNNYSIYPQYDYQAGKSRITGYNVTANLSITVRKLETVNDVIDSATSLGANTVGGIQFTVNDDRRKELVKEARVKAVEDAKEKASGLSQAAGMTLGRLVNIQESSPEFIRPMYAALNKTAMGGGADMATEVQPGSTDITSSVTLFYETR